MMDIAISFLSIAFRTMFSLQGLIYLIVLGFFLGRWGRSVLYIIIIGVFFTLPIWTAQLLLVIGHYDRLLTNTYVDQAGYLIWSGFGVGLIVFNVLKIIRNKSDMLTLEDQGVSILPAFLDSKKTIAEFKSQKNWVRVLLFLVMVICVSFSASLIAVLGSTMSFDYHAYVNYYRTHSTGGFRNANIGLLVYATGVISFVFVQICFSVACLKNQSLKRRVISRWSRFRLMFCLIKIAVGCGILIYMFRV